MSVHTLRFSHLDVDAGYLSPVISVSQLPSINAALNTLSAVFLFSGFSLSEEEILDCTGRVCFRPLRARWLFLACYLTYHYQVGSVPFKGQGRIRTGLFHDSYHAHDSRGCYCPARADHLESSAESKIRVAPTNCALDVSDLALRFGYRSHCLLDAL